MPTPVVLGSTREMWFANLADAAPQWSFLEDPVGTSKTSGGIGRTQRLGDPINTGPNSTWNQLTWQGGEGQDVWKDEQMYQYGDMDVVNYTGKVHMWPGFQSWYKNDKAGYAMGAAMCEGTQAHVDWKQTPLYLGMRDHISNELWSAAYLLYRINPGYPLGSSKAIETLHYSNEPYRIVMNPQGDDFSAGVILFCTATKMYVLYEFNPAKSRVLQDTNAPSTGSQGFKFCHDTAAAFNGAVYYGHGNRLYKRVPKPPYGNLGTHTLVKNVASAAALRGMCVWNNRLYFGASFPNGKGEVLVSDGATTQKAFEFPHQFRMTKMVAHAGALYMVGYTYSNLDVNPGGSIIQEVWRYDGTSLKRLWKEGKHGDSQFHWPSDIITHDGMVVWARQGTDHNQVGIRTNTDNNKARLVFYDPVNDAIVSGPGIAYENSNRGQGSNNTVGAGLWITGLSTWNNSIAAYFKDATNYPGPAWGPTMMATVRGEGKPRNDLRWPHTGDVAQFDANTGFCRQFVQSSEYHGPDDVALERKTWLSVRARVRLTGPHVSLDVLHIDPDTSVTTLLTTLTSASLGTTNWTSIIVPIKSGANYISGRKIQLRFEAANDGTVDSQEDVWIDDAAVQYTIDPLKVRQWQVRIPLSDAQANLHGGNNSLATADALAQKLEDLFFAGVPVKFWEPSAAGTTPANNAYIEARIQTFNRTQSRLASDETGLTGSVSMTLVENVIA